VKFRRNRSWQYPYPQGQLTLLLMYSTN